MFDERVRRAGFSRLGLHTTYIFGPSSGVGLCHEYLDKCRIHKGYVLTGTTTISCSSCDTAGEFSFEICLVLIYKLGLVNFSRYVVW